ncbi:MAG: hypothetical protein U0T56_01785 [Ferruginibacter sp.]
MYQHYREGDVIMDYGKYIRMMPIVLKGTVKVMRMDENGKGDSCITWEAARAVQWLIAVAWKLRKARSGQWRKMMWS